MADNTDRPEQDLPEWQRRSFAMRDDPNAQKVAGTVGKGVGWLKGLSKSLADKGLAKLDDTKQRLAEAPLSSEELDLLADYRQIREFLSAEQLASLPTLPGDETSLNRRDFRAFLATPALPALIAFGRAAEAEADAAQRERDAVERKRRAEAAAREAAQEARNLQVRAEQVDKFYANTLNDIRISIGQISHLIPPGALAQAGDLAFEGSRGAAQKNWLGGQSQDLTDAAGKYLYKAVRKGAATDAIGSARFQRSLVSMSDQERAALRLADLLEAAGIISSDDVLRARVPIVWNKGECLVELDGAYHDNLQKREAALAAVKTLISSYFGEAATGMEMVKDRLSKVMSSAGTHPTMRAVLERYIVSGSRWMMPVEATGLAPDPASPSVLRLGTFAGTDQEFLFDMKESLITVAAPGTGKSQAHVLRNLLYLKAPAVVLDIKGEMKDRSAGWRHGEVGPVHVFSPTTPLASLSYNPLDHVPRDPEIAWDAARRLADLLVVPSAAKGGDDYFEGRARDMITTAVLDVALSQPEEHRNMATVLDRLYVSDDEQLLGWFTHLEGLGVPQLRRQASALKGMPPKQREGILDSARRQLEIWQSPALDRLCRSTDFSADMLRRENATLYLCVALEDIKKYASVLRVIIGQTIQQLCRVMPQDGELPVTFFLDEMPRLGRMDVLEEGLDVGRGYGVRLWMFCQNRGQLETSYPNADGMLKNCAIRAYMNPDEETAQLLSRNLGAREGLLDGSRRPLAEASALAGPDFANQVLVFSRSGNAARLDKRPAYADPQCLKRMETPGSVTTDGV